MKPEAVVDHLAHLVPVHLVEDLVEVVLQLVVAQADLLVVHTKASPLPATSQSLPQKLLQSAALATKDHLVLLELRESPDRMVRTETMDQMDRMERTLKVFQPNWRSLALSAHQDHLAHKDLPDQRDRLDPRDLLESHHAMVFPESKACKASPAQLDVPDAKDHVEPQASLVDLSQCLDLRDLLASLEHPESRDQRVSLDQTDSPSKAHLDLPETLESLDAKAALDLLDQLDQLERMERRAPATTAQNPVLHLATSLVLVAVPTVVELETTSSRELHEAAITRMAPHNDEPLLLPQWHYSKMVKFEAFHFILS